jgi:type II secretory pathway pseudopilin PulG
MKIKNSRSNLIKNQSGIASMVVVILIMTLLTLVVLATTRNSNREQQQALDRQLSTQAFYAAESGISDAKDYIVDPPPSAPRPIEKDNCDGLGTANGTGNQFPGKDAQVGDFENTKYTCVLYDRTPDELFYFPINVKSPTIVPIEDAGGEKINSITFKWNQAGGGSNFGSCPGGGVTLPKQIPNNNCDAGMLRIELVDPSSTNRQQLINSTFLIYVKPSSSGGSPTFAYNNASGNVNKQGAITSGGCGADGCEITIDGISASSDVEKLYLNLRSIYKLNDVTISGQRAGGSIRFRDAQMEVDSTGQSGDILKRVQVMVDLTKLNSGFIPAFVLQTSSDLCKRLEVKRD